MHIFVGLSKISAKESNSKASQSLIKTEGHLQKRLQLTYKMTETHIKS